MRSRASRKAFPKLELGNETNSSDPFWNPRTLEEIAAIQGVQPIKNADVLIGGWPEDELNDNFEETFNSRSMLSMEMHTVTLCVTQNSDVIFFG